MPYASFEKWREYQRNRDRGTYVRDRCWAIRAEALRVFGGQVPECACCGESVERLLTLDHVDGNGREHERSLTKSGVNWLWPLKRRGWVSESPLQVLCWNCNCGKQVNGGVCPHHGVEKLPTGRTRPEIVRRYKQNLRREALRVFGGNPPSCACCGELLERFLTLDHVNGGGNKHRRELSSSPGPVGWVAAIKRNGWKSEEPIQVLCYNCNMGRSVNGGICPHNAEGGRQRGLFE